MKEQATVTKTDLGWRVQYIGTDGEPGEMTFPVFQEDKAREWAESAPVTCIGTTPKSKYLAALEWLRDAERGHERATAEAERARVRFDEVADFALAHPILVNPDEYLDAYEAENKAKFKLHRARTTREAMRRAVAEAAKNLQAAEKEKSNGDE